MEAAARDGDMEGVRALLKEYDLATKSSFGGSNSLGSAQSIFTSRGSASLWLLTYFGYNALATAYDYRVTSVEAAAVNKKHGGGTVALHVRALDFKGKMESTTPTGEQVTSRQVALLPHIYVSDLFFGRSKWSVTVKKQPGQTQWSTGPHPDDEQSGDGAGDGAGGRTFEFNFGGSGGGKRRGGGGGGGGGADGGAGGAGGGSEGSV